MKIIYTNSAIYTVKNVTKKSHYIRPVYISKRDARLLKKLFNVDASTLDGTVENLLQAVEAVTYKVTVDDVFHPEWRYIETVDGTYGIVFERDIKDRTRVVSLVVTE